jgi:hypothetical protein
MKTCQGCRCKAPNILKIGARRRWMVSFITPASLPSLKKSSFYPLNGRLGRLKKLVWMSCQRKAPQSLLEIKPQSFSHSQPLNLYCLCITACTWSSCACFASAYIDGCNSIQFDCIKRHTISPWLYKSPHRSRHVVTCSCQSISCLQIVKVQGCLFHKCNECSLSNTAWHLVLT